MMTGTVLFGRGRAVETLRRDLDQVQTSHGGLVLITGEAGIGKSTLLAEALAQAREAGALVATGSCWQQDAAPGYWPWIQVLRALDRTGTPAMLGDPPDPALCRLLGDPLGSEDAATPATGGHAAFQLADAVSSVLARAAQEHPVLVALEDLHWADPASLRLLEFVAAHTWYERVLVIGTYRDDEVQVGEHPARGSLSALAAKATSLPLAGLDRAAVGELIASVTGKLPAESVLADVARRTGGNPFFVEHTARVSGANGAMTSLAAGLRATLDRRLSLLPGEVREVLAVASVLGTDFPSGLLAAVDRRAGGHLREVLGVATSARLLSQPEPGRWEFTHELVRDALYAALDGSEARRRHAEVVRVIEREPSLARGAAPAELAHHACRAYPELDHDEVLRHLLAAAREARHRLAFDEAISHYVQALGAASPSLTTSDFPGLAASPATQLRGEVAVELAETEQHAGYLTEARRSYRGVQETARELNDPALLAKAALGIHELGSSEQEWERDLDLLEQAWTRLDRADPGAIDTLSVRLMAAVSRERHSWRSVDKSESEQLAARALELARECGDDRALGFALLARHDVIWSPATAGERLGLADEMRDVARRQDDTELGLRAALLRMSALLERGDPRGLTQYEAFMTAAERSGLPRWRFVARSRQAALATLQGRFDEAGTHMDAAYELGAHLGEVDAAYLWQSQRFALELLRGRFADAAAALEPTEPPNDDFATFDSAMLAVNRGDVETALSYMDAASYEATLIPAGFSAAGLRLTAQLAAISGDHERCDEARKELARAPDSWGVQGAAAIIDGPLRLWTAVLDAAQERWSEAVDGFTAAEHTAERLGARPWVAEARLGQAEARLGRGGEDDAAEAARLVLAVLAEAEELDMAHLAGRARAVSAALHPVSPPGDDRTRSAARQAGGPYAGGPYAGDRYAGELRFDGRLWVLGFAGVTVHMGDAKGLHDLQALLRRPGAHMSAVALANPKGGAETEVARRFGGDAVLDEQARSAYRRRLTELDEAIEQATATHDDPRAARLDAERQALLDELRQATGFGGRSRRLGDEAERARKTVTARIRDVLRRLDQHHPQLSTHLRASVATGATCCYQPTEHVEWSF